MHPKEIFAQATSQSVQAELTNLQRYDDSLTVADIRKTLASLLPNREEAEAKERARYKELLEGKCLRVVFAEHHIVYLQPIGEIELPMEFGSVSPKFRALRVNYYKGQVECGIEDVKWDSYSYNDGVEQVNADDEFYPMVVQYNELVTKIFKGEPPAKFMR